jgi:hypothetical protein|tara:strand:+ start:2709 stop:2954 length:246 start_codon:yes stop_codon:yes gene_type:complete
MNSVDMIYRLISIEAETLDNIYKEIPVAILEVAKIITDNYQSELDIDIESEKLKALFIAGYIAAKNEQRIILDDIFLNGEE